MPHNSTPTVAPDELTALVNRALGQHPHLRGQRLRFEMGDGRIVLRGDVASYYQKQMAQEALRPLLSRTTIDNQLTVRVDG